MDYKYIEQLLERYWECKTTPEEEKLLQDFYLQPHVPNNLEKYRCLFDYEREEKDICLDSDFDERILHEVGETIVEAKHNNLFFRLYPIYRAVAIVAIVFTLGMAAQHSFSTEKDSSETTINYASYKDTYTDPQVAYEQVASALKEVSEGLRDADPARRDDPRVRLHQQVRLV